MTEVHRPPGPEPHVPSVPLAPRENALRQLALVATMPPGSGVGEVISELVASFAARGVETIVVERRTYLALDDADQEPLRGGDHDAALFIVGPSTTILGVAYAAASDLEAHGIPSLLLVPDVLHMQNEHEGQRSDAPIRSVLRSSSGCPAASDLISAITAPLRPSESDPSNAAVPTASESFLRGGDDELHERFAKAGWTDGLPIMLPTPARVAAMLAGTSRDALECVVTRLPPEGGAVTVQDVAVVAVMSGAHPEHLPIILAAASLAGDPQFDAMTRSVNSFAFAQLVSGPYAVEAGMAGGLGALSPGHHANAVVGRALSLLQRTAGGARLGASISPVQGNVAAFGMAFAENSDESPWPAYHVDRGHASGETTLTLFSGGQSHLGNFYYDDLDEIAAAMTSVDLYAGALVLLSAKRARQLAADGLSRDDVVEQLRDRARVPLRRFRESGFYPLRSASISRGDSDAWPQHYLDGPDDELVPAFPPGGVDVAVVGSALSSLAQVWFMRSHGTASVDAWR